MVISLENYNTISSSVLVRTGYYSKPIEQFIHAHSENALFEIELKYERDEKVWVASCRSIPGLHIECESQEEAEEEVLKWAPELLVDNHIISPGIVPAFTFCVD